MEGARMTTLLKTLTWALVSGVLIGGAAYWETRNVWVAFVTAVWAVSLKTPAYTVHEWLWNKATGHHKMHLPEGTVDEEDEEAAIAA